MFAEMTYSAVVIAIFAPGLGLLLMFLMMGRLAKKRRRAASSGSH